MSDTPLQSGTDYLRAILSSKIYDLAQVTPLQKMEKLSERLGNHISIKREDRQPVHSFKLRGAYAMISNLSPAQKNAGVIAASAGNHAQGVALSAKHLGLRALIVMPQNTPSIKVDAVRGFGGEVLLYGANFDEAKAKAIELSQELNMTFVHPFDHPLVIAGQGSIGMELLQQNADLNYIFVPVGGGGLIAGIAVLIKQLMPEIKVIGVESKDSACLFYALQAGQPVDLERVGLFADGVAVKRVGDETFRLCQKYVDDVVLVDNDEICAALKDVFENVRAVAEPSGALSLAGLKKYVAQHNLEGRNLACILSGANLNFHTLRYVSERCEIGEKHEALLAVSIPEQKGAFLKFCQIIGNRAVTEFNYRHADDQQACIFVGVRISGNAEKLEIIKDLQQNGYPVTDLSDDDIAKTHIRYMVGGRPSSIQQEELYSFEFPEQKGALLKFLQSLIDWDISLFHYRAHGADYGDILAAFVVNSSEKEAFKQDLDRLGYRYQDVNDSPAYQYFLR
ncbi:threonine ammonia-lyase, biosynthetic [Glaesserella parasuis]|uniref:L-threonine dehydratase n=1 Tax=Glaesserella parasuis ZJ0906 TaxID=1322346 RepID=A0A806J7D2_GLAPU|nr:threonine ammonia-lyase, biosynthetic [Glaesserella parasuis]AGO15576.1 threonine dehydratase [Glaesserella parasuis ZJ0906]ATW44872.1 PLP-dependent threonine dehydratase [Glaesserella parasuis str. Nagasaki]EQA02465.1 threonine ammonia-lyase, biosynthetic [Glaesserella parasuis str. Nagasaki]EQA11571.1 threonine ammonia-lyase, biosynthetic [Glaesserella parasuis 84-15995]EYE72309.1 threonine dehydratase [Glaesserella parasuis str. Nagasaki]